MRTPLTKLLALLLAFGLIAAACGGGCAAEVLYDLGAVVHVQLGGLLGVHLGEHELLVEFLLSGGSTVDAQLGTAHLGAWLEPVREVLSLEKLNRACFFIFSKSC